MLAAAVPGHLDERVRDRIVAETRGNPLGLLELARGMSEAELAGFADPPPASSPGASWPSPARAPASAARWRSPVPAAKRT